jgi:cyclophilin family peptidyl-prolyl cis-trans isomerase/HEAT repeat protein
MRPAKHASRRTRTHAPARAATRAAGRSALRALALLACGCGATGDAGGAGGAGEATTRPAPRAAEPAPEPPRTATPIPPADLLTDPVDDGSLVAGLHHAEAAVRLVAARGLAQRPRSDAATALAEQAAAETEPAVLAELLFAIGQRHDVSLAGPVEAALGHAEPSVRAAACLALGHLADDGRTPALVARLADADAGVRGAAALALFALDGRRYTHARTATEATLLARDAALAQLALRDADSGVRWRATCALAGVRGRRGLATVLESCLRDTEPLCRTFALAGLAALQRESLADARAVPPLLADADERVVVAALRALALHGAPGDIARTLREAPSALVRLSAVEALSERLAQPDATDDMRRAGTDELAAAGENDASPMVRRQAASALIAIADEGRALYFLHALSGSADWRDRQRAAEALAAGPLRDDETLAALLDDDSAPVQAAALGVSGARPALRHDQLLRALRSEDPATLAAAADALRAELDAGTAEPALVEAMAAALDRARGFELKEGRQALRRALGLPPDGERPAPAPPGRLLDRLIAQDRAARADPAPRVILSTTRGDIVLVLDRIAAPVHVASLLELAEAGCYDGLDIHRVVPDFVVQGLDPRGDGFGTGGRRLPDEFSARPYLTGSVGMPNAGEAHTGGCQLFLTHLPTPHLDGHYTWFGQVLSGGDAMQRLEIGDRVQSVQRIP